MTVSNTRLLLAIMVVGSALVMGFCVVLGWAPTNPASAGAAGIVIGNAFAECKIILARYFPSGDSETSRQPEKT